MMRHLEEFLSYSLASTLPYGSVDCLGEHGCADTSPMLYMSESSVCTSPDLGRSPERPALESEPDAATIVNAAQP